MPQSPSVPLGPHTVLPAAISYPVVFSQISLMVWSLFPFKGDFSFRKARSCRVPNLGCRRAESPGWFDVMPKKLCTRFDTWAGVSSWWSCQSPVAHSWSLLNHQISLCGGVFKLNTKLDADSLLYSLSHFECDGHTVHTLTQRHPLPPLTSTVKSSLFTHVHPVLSPWLPGYIDVV